MSWNKTNRKPVSPNFSWLSGCLTANPINLLQVRLASIAESLRPIVRIFWFNLQGTFWHWLVHALITAQVIHTCACLIRIMNDSVGVVQISDGTSFQVPQYKIPKAVHYFICYSIEEWPPGPEKNYIIWSKGLWAHPLSQSDLTDWPHR